MPERLPDPWGGHQPQLPLPGINQRVIREPGNSFPAPPLPELRPLAKTKGKRVATVHELPTLKVPATIHTQPTLIPPAPTEDLAKLF
jgi:hypothetical protein